MKKAIALVTSLMIIMALSSCGPTTSETVNNDSEKTSDESVPMNSVDAEESEEDTADVKEEDDDETSSNSKKNRGQRKKWTKRNYY
ncbi:hypothetical protein [Ruminococcus sp. HUN007]|uniref:hypothetical protein n=1 Tax=Ruminococcus sp. HUN007 TaxID=1514668 RepID=UPI0005D1CF37|nr:hypothetical protein [Ruminococcus sp. HUN007]